MSQVKTIRDIFAPAFWRTWNDIYYKRVGTVSLSGGRGSTKSTFCADAIMLRMEMARRRALERKAAGDKDWRKLLTHAACFRKVGGTLADSCFSQFQWCAAQLGLADRYIFRKTPLTIIRKGTDQRIYFRGLDDPLKARSLRTPFSYISDLWFEETSEYSGIEEIQDVTRSIQRGGSEFMTYYSYNPPETSSNWVNYSLAQLEEEDPTFKRYASDYRSVPPEWLGEKFFRDAEILRRLDERQYRHVYLGEITGNGGTVFPRVKLVEFSDDDIARFENVRWGADFGLRDPTTLIGLNYDKGGQRVQIFSEWYKTDATLDEIEEGFKRNHFGYEYIYGDCAAGTLITTLRAHGLPILPSEKGKGSILNGIKGLQSMVSIEIDKRRCPHTYWEFTHMEYEKDKSGGFTGNIPPGNDHCVDPCRYALVKDLENFSPFG